MTPNKWGALARLGQLPSHLSGYAYLTNESTHYIQLPSSIMTLCATFVLFFAVVSLCELQQETGLEMCRICFKSLPPRGKALFPSINTIKLQKFTQVLYLFIFRLQKAQTELVIKKNQCLNLGIDVDASLE
jgi:hypothetical protein